MVPYKPSNPGATPSAGKIDLTWQDNSSNETSFQIYRKPGGCAAAGTWSLLKSAAVNAESYSDTSLVIGSTYAYKVRAVSKSAAIPYAYGYSMFTGCVSAVAE